MRRIVRSRAANRCEYCRSPEEFSASVFSVEHILPRSAGGADAQDNLALCCQECNNRKYTHTSAIDPLSGETVPLFHPRRDRWAEHFAWAEGFAVMIGLTRTGRATVEKLQLNRPGLVALRGVLHRAGELPPPDEQ